MGAWWRDKGSETVDDEQIRKIKRIITGEK